MRGIKTIIKKELADHFSSYRFTIIFALIAMLSLITAYMVGMNIREELAGIAKPQFIFLMLFTSSGALFSLVQFVAFFGDKDIDDFIVLAQLDRNDPIASRPTV